MVTSLLKYSICGFSIKFLYKHISEGKLHQPVNTHIHGIPEVGTTFPDITNHVPLNDIKLHVSDGNRKDFHE